MDAAAPPLVAGVDLGSNSFHMIVARLAGTRLEVLDKLRDNVRLQAGLDDRKILSDEAMGRALECLSRFGQRLAHMGAGSVRAVGTNTLRQAKNTDRFLPLAEAALGHPIEIIYGREEARLVYLGVAHAMPELAGHRLVVDIGGGSTECILGEGNEPLELHSLYMGSVSYSMRFFPDGRIREEDMRRAEIAAQLELRSLTRGFFEQGWSHAVGSSGTILASAEVLRANGWSNQGITAKGLKKLRKAIITAGNAQTLNLPGLQPQRAPVFAGGIAILSAVFDALGLEQLAVSDSALREGIVLDLLGRIRHEDARDHTIRHFTKQFTIDELQAERVEKTVRELLDQAAEPWDLGNEACAHYLAWAARLSEIGLSVAYSGYHKHSAYIVLNADMPGFSRDEQRVLAALLENQRRKLRLESFAQARALSIKTATRLCVLLRLSVALNRSRSPEPLPKLELAVKKTSLALRFPTDWLEKNPLTRADLEEEASRLASAGFDLQIQTN
ncbi:MAG: exopolyphosphatase [Deltaproteobacteria bacterium]|nr:exopolyphosphatase [Deltaproteobacteria bacterium]